MSTPKAGAWSIDELAHLAGVPSRTIREYRTLGVLAPPSKVGRVGVYTEQHLQRLRLISRLQSRGYSLAGIRDLVDARHRGESLEDIIGESGIDEAVLILTTTQLVARSPALHSASARALASEAGLIHATNDDHWHVRSPALLTMVDDATRGGVGFAAVLTVVRAMRDGARVQAAQLATTFVTELWNQSAGANFEQAVRRFRILAARSASSLVVDELARALRGHAHATGDDALIDLMDAVAIGGHGGTSSSAGD